MEMRILLSGSDATEESVLGLQDWIGKEQIGGVRVERESGAPTAGEMGLEPMTILSVVLGSAAVVELVKSVHVWLSVRRPKLNVRLRVGASEIEIDAENLPDQQKIVDKVLEHIGEGKE